MGNEKRWRLVLLLLVLTAGMVVLGSWQWLDREEMADDLPDLVVYSPHPAEFTQPLLDEFEKEAGVRVRLVNGGTGKLLQRVREEQENPQVDVLWGGAVSMIKPDAGLFAEYETVNENMMRPEFKNREGCLTRFTDVPSVLLVNTDLVGDWKIEGYEDLLDPRLHGKIAMADPALSSSSYEQLINMLYAMGKGNPEDGWDYIRSLADNLDGNLLESSADVYDGVARGRYVVGCTFEEAALTYQRAGAPVRIVYMKEGVISEPDGVYIVRNAKHLAAAKKFVDFITGHGAQSFIARNLHRRSVRKDVAAPEGLQEKDNLVMISADAGDTEEIRQEWLERFCRIFHGEKG